MSAGDAATLQRTPLYEQHKSAGAKLVEFGGWEMPVSYRGILEEHRAVRTAAGLFDVSHMGEIEVVGPDAAALCQHLTTNDVHSLGNGHVQYTLLCREDGGVVDDVTLYRVNEQRFFFCVNASNIAKDRDWIESHAGSATVVDRSEHTALIALQGPMAARILGRLTPLTLNGLRRFRFARSEVAGIPALISRTGYTGEDGFELYVDAPRAVALWTALMDAGRGDGLEPIGLGARDTLRLEAALALYGHELDDQTSPLAAGLARFVKLDGDEFIGRQALLHEQAQGTPRRLVGLAMRAPGIARQGYAVLHDGANVGVVTSGTHSPTLASAVALAYVADALATAGTMVAVDIRGRSVPAEVVPTPFYRRARPAPVAVSAVPVEAGEEPEILDDPSDEDEDDAEPMPADVAHTSHVAEVELVADVPAESGASLAIEPADEAPEPGDPATAPEEGDR